MPLCSPLRLLPSPLLTPSQWVSHGEVECEGWGQDRTGKKRKGNPSFRQRCHKWSPVSCTIRHMTVPMYQLSFINSCQQRFSRQMSVSVEAITAHRCLAKPSSQRLPLLQLYWQSALLQAKVSWISSYHLDQLLKQCWLTAAAGQGVLT